MGADIHMYVEYRNGNLPWQADDHHVKKPNWHCADENRSDKYRVLPKDYCDACKMGEYLKCSDKELFVDVPQVACVGRNYQIFAALAGVRGAGPEPRGLPDDVSPIIAWRSEDYGYDGHSHSWCTPEELKSILENAYDEVTYKDFECSDDAFHDQPGSSWQTTHGYFTLLAYAEKLKKDKNLDREIFGADAETDVQVRFVFWFDN